MEITVGSLFCGIGGIDMGFMQSGFKTLWAIERDSACCKTILHNFSDIGLIHSDIRRVDPYKLPSVDVITAGFPCQPFSIGGNQHGFADPRGNLFYEVARFTSALLPRFVFMENVSNLMTHDNERTFLVIHRIFSELGYTLKYRVLRSSEYGNVPQIRDRIYLIAFRRHEDCDWFTFPEAVLLSTHINSIVCRNQEKHRIYYYYEDNPFFDHVKRVVTDCPLPGIIDNKKHQKTE